MNRSISNVATPAIAPSILTADFGRLRGQIHEAEAAGVDLIHLDVMDGHFVPNISFGPLVISAIREATTLPLDVHLMIEHPERYIDAFVEAGADLITIHVESTPHPHRAIQQIREQNVEAGIAVNPATPLSAVEELLENVQLVLLMSVNPGYGGQAFIPQTPEKIRKMRSMIDERKLDRVRIEVDGGINRETIRTASAAGADIFVTGSSVYSDREPVSTAVSALRGALGA